MVGFCRNAKNPMGKKALPGPLSHAHMIYLDTPLRVDSHFKRVNRITMCECEDNSLKVNDGKCTFHDINWYIKWDVERIMKVWLKSMRKVGESYRGVMIFVFESFEAKYLLIRRGLEIFSAGIHEVNLSAHKTL